MAVAATPPQLHVVGDVPILEVRDVRVEFGGVRALDVERMAFGAGRMIALIGPNGAGKTTLFDAISGLVPVSRGSILLDGRHDLCRMAPVARAQHGIGRSFQSAALFESLTVAETLLVALEREMQASGPLSSAFRLRGARAVERRAQRAVDELIELMGLGAFHDKFISELSTGTRRIVDLACVVAFRPRLLLLDEPSSGIAQREVEALGALLLEVRRAVGCTMVVVEHDIPLVRELAEEVFALETGRVIAHGTPEEVLSSDVVVQSYLGTGTRAVERSGAAGIR